MDIQQIVAEAMPTRSDVPEAVSVLVLTETRAVALILAPILAKRLYPTRQFGDVLFAEQTPDGFEVDVRVQQRFDHAIISRVQNNR